MQDQPSPHEVTFWGRPKASKNFILSKKACATLISILDENETSLPARGLNTTMLHYIKENLAQYEQALEDIDPSKIVPIPSEIAWPIWQRFAYASNSVMSKAYIQLLATASSVETQHLAHPGFIQLIDQITPDEIQILFFINTHGAITEPIMISGARMSLKKIIGFNYPQNLRTYLEHLDNLGLIILEESHFMEYDKYTGSSDVALIGKALNPNEQLGEIKTPKSNSYNLTHYGQMFLIACSA